MKGTKCITFQLQSSAQLDKLMDTFKQMCNDCIRIAVLAQPKNRFQLQGIIYDKLKQYGLHSHYILSACEVAYSVYKNKKRKSIPYVKKSFLKLDNHSYDLNYMLLKIPIKPREYIQLPLKGSNYYLQFLLDETLKKGSITITGTKIIISFTKEVEPRQVHHYLGIDTNEKNLTCADTNENISHYNTTSIFVIKQRYKNIRAEIANKTQNDNRVKTRLLSKYGKREKNRVIQRIHKISRQIVDHAKSNSLGINMEKLTNIRRMYRKGNGQGTSFRFRLNSWSFREFQRQIEYKAIWDGVPVNFINPRFTSRNCSKCNSHLEELENRKMLCTSCGITWDRDENAAINIASAPLVRAARSHR